MSVINGVILTRSILKPFRKTFSVTFAIRFPVIKTLSSLTCRQQLAQLNWTFPCSDRETLYWCVLAVCLLWKQRVASATVKSIALYYSNMTESGLIQGGSSNFYSLPDYLTYERKPWQYKFIEVLLSSSISTTKINSIWPFVIGIQQFIRSVDVFF